MTCQACQGFTRAIVKRTRLFGFPVSNSRNHRTTLLRDYDVMVEVANLAGAEKFSDGYNHASSSLYDSSRPEWCESEAINIMNISLGLNQT